MLVVDNWGFTFSLERDGRSVHALLQFELEAYDNYELGYTMWAGDLRSNIGAKNAVDGGSFEDPTTLVNDYTALLTPGVTVAGGFYAQDDFYGGPEQGKFFVTLFEAAANFTGTSRMDIVFGSASDDTFRSSIGGDIFEGGAGNDLYLIYQADARILEAVGEGTADRVATAISYALADGVEIEELRTTKASATAALNLTGNEFAQSIFGNAGDNILDGKGGVDVMVGGAGNDFYYVDNAGDVVVEHAAGGEDRVAVVDTSYVLGSAARVEMLTTDDSKGVLGLALTGNSYDQMIVGNAGDNVLDGRGGGDTLVGGRGNDTCYVDSADDVVIEKANQGYADIVVARGVDYALAAGVQAETLRTSASGGTLDMDLTGNEFAQTIVGNAGDNVLAGGGGSDTLFGLGGTDTFLFDAALSSSGNYDTIVDFSIANDTIQLDHQVFDLMTGAMEVTRFKDISAGPIDADDRILYNSLHGILYYDADGSGTAFAAVKFAHLSNDAALTAADFVVV